MDGHIGRNRVTAGLFIDRCCSTAIGEASGASITDFVVLAAQQAAVETIRDFESLTLSSEASRAFVDALLNPPAPNAALRAAAQRHLSILA